VRVGGTIPFATRSQVPRYFGMTLELRTQPALWSFRVFARQDDGGRDLGLALRVRVTRARRLALLRG
jgi:hypothetical protein